MKVHDGQGKLTPDAIVWLARRVWWGEYDGVRVDGELVKRCELKWWWSRERWPDWWPQGRQWVEVSDGLCVLLGRDHVYIWKPWLSSSRPPADAWTDGD